MKKLWRVWNLINSTMRIWKFSNYLEIGGDGKVCRMIKKGAEIVTPSNIPRDWALYEYDMGIEDFFSYISQDKTDHYDIILLREWDEDNLEDRIKACFEMISNDGFLLVEGFGERGERGEAWRVCAGLKKAKIPVGLINGYLQVFKAGIGIIEDSLRVKTKKSTFEKNPEKYLP